MARHRKKKRPMREVKKNPHKINEEIKFHEIGEDVRFVTEGGSEIITLREARKKADDEGLDLVLMNANAQPPVVKVMDYSKFLYELNKKKPQNKPKPLKEVRFTPNTDSNDLKFKTKHIINFLEKGHKVKVFVFFRGREMAFQDRGEKMLLELAVNLEDYGVVESMPKMEGRKMNMFIKPKDKK